MDGGAWWATVREVTKSRTRPRDFTLPYLTERSRQSFPSSTAERPIRHLLRDSPMPGSEGERTAVQGLGVTEESGHTGDSRDEAQAGCGGVQD